MRTAGAEHPPSVQNDAEVALVGAEGAARVQFAPVVDEDVPGAQDDGRIVVFNDQLS